MSINFQCCGYAELILVGTAILRPSDEYRWSSYRAKIGLEQGDILDFVDCPLGLNKPAIDYAASIKLGMPDEEYEII